MATFGYGPFDNEFALDFVADFAAASAKRRLSMLRKALNEYLEYAGPRMQGDVALSQSELDSLVSAFGSIERAVGELGLEFSGGRYFLKVDGVAIAQPAFAAAAIVFGSSPANAGRHLEDALGDLSEGPVKLRPLAIRALQALSADESTLMRWIEGETSAQIAAVRDEIGKLLPAE
jgi:hypothetical protein